MVGKVDVREKREGGAVGAKGRAGGRLAIARALTGLGGDSGEAVAGGSAAAAAAAERRGVYASSSIWWAVRRFFVSQAVLSCTLGETAGRAVHVAKRVRPARSAPAQP